MKTAECVYCQEPKQVKIWDKTDELVCLDCRKDMLEQEFKDAQKLGMSLSRTNPNFGAIVLIKGNPQTDVLLVSDVNLGQPVDKPLD